jgi:hypothetical protein
MTKKVRTVKLYTKDDLSGWVYAEYVDARMDVDFNVTLDRHFVRTSQRGLPWECLLAKAIVRAALTDPTLFPHPALHAYVIGGTVYVIDRYPQRGNQIVHTVRYVHNFTKRLRKFDNFSKRTFIKHFGDEGCVVRLRPPVERDQSGSRPTGPRDGSRTKKVLNGAERRARDAGLVAPSAA